jgi:hypothetical protein
MDCFEERMALLEKQVRTLKIVAITCSLLLGLALILGAANSQTPNLISAHRIQVTDDQDRVVFDVESSNGSAGWVLRDAATGHIAVSAYAQGGGGLTIYQANGSHAVRICDRPNNRGGLLTVFGAAGQDIFSVVDPNIRGRAFGPAIAGASAATAPSASQNRPTSAPAKEGPTSVNGVVQ